MKKVVLLITPLALTPTLTHAAVSVYGSLEISFESVKATGATAPGKDSPQVARVNSNSSLFGFKGSEELGNGLKAIWQVESGIPMDVGGGALASRDTFIGLTGSAGTIQAGLLTQPNRNLAGVQDPTQANTGIGMSGALIGKLGNTLLSDPLLKTFSSAPPSDGGGNTLIRSGPFDTRRKNAIAYSTPRWNGLTAKVLYAAIESSPSGAGHKPYGLSLGVGYDQAALLLQAAYEELNTGIDNAPVSVTQFKKVSNTRLGGYYRFGQASRVGLLYDRTVGNLTASAAGQYPSNKLAQNVWYAQAVLGVTPSSRVVSQYGQAGKLQGTSQSGAKHFVLGYEYDLSKRTTVKAVYSLIRNQDSAAYDFGIGSIGNVAAGASPRGLALALRHNF
jgi:predicted porin